MRLSRCNHKRVKRVSGWIFTALLNGRQFRLLAKVGNLRPRGTRR